MELGQEIIRRLAGHAVRAEVLRWEIFQVPGYDDGGFPGDGGCEHMPIARIR